MKSGCLSPELREIEALSERKSPALPLSQLIQWALEGKGPRCAGTGWKQGALVQCCGLRAPFSDGSQPRHETRFTPPRAAAPGG